HVERHVLDRPLVAEPPSGVIERDRHVVRDLHPSDPPQPPNPGGSLTSCAWFLVAMLRRSARHSRRSRAPRSTGYGTCRAIRGERRLPVCQYRWGMGCAPASGPLPRARGRGGRPSPLSPPPNLGEGNYEALQCALAPLAQDWARGAGERAAPSPAGRGL